MQGVAAFKGALEGVWRQALRTEWNTALRQWRELQKQIREQTSKRGGTVPATKPQEEEEIMEEWANYLYL
ncbi:hypothetical protein CYMTET_30599 [Cymbomonas tetramitiformis]|uniref:Uncharacterized protein n=1 Tax=Cymbomonas tetramitiformis TaxID=36881 RepID=A0AAE0FIT5_9CHLO|nr:hypothetical protein CYMTET_30599 [Cymbomonas tetramitiformis]